MFSPPAVMISSFLRVCVLAIGPGAVAPVCLAHAQRDQVRVRVDVAQKSRCDRLAARCHVFLPECPALQVTPIAVGCECERERAPNGDAAESGKGNCMPAHVSRATARPCERWGRFESPGRWERRLGYAYARGFLGAAAQPASPWLGRARVELVPELATARRTVQRPPRQLVLRDRRDVGRALLALCVGRALALRRR
jgi:hypothetical protein